MYLLISRRETRYVPTERENIQDPVRWLVVGDFSQVSLHRGTDLCERGSWTLLDDLVDMVH